MGFCTLMGLHTYGVCTPMGFDTDGGRQYGVAWRGCTLMGWPIWGCMEGFCTLMGFAHLWGCTLVGSHTLIGCWEWDLHKDLHTYRIQVGICTFMGVAMLGFARGFAHLWGPGMGFCTGICTLIGSRMGFAHL